MQRERMARYNLAQEAAFLALENYKVVYLTLQGSQNYNLDFYDEDYQSDFDFKAVIIPSLDEVLRGAAKVSTKIDYLYGQIDIKDIRVWEEVLQKGNPSYLEGLFTDYYWIDPEYKDYFNFMREFREEYAWTFRLQLLKSSVGMMYEKDKAMCHPYPTIRHKIEKWGYDGKQSSHLIRLYCFLTQYFIKHSTLKEAFDVTSYDPIIYGEIFSHKYNMPSLEDALDDSKKYLKAVESLKEKVLISFNSNPLDYEWKYKYHDKVIEAIRYSVTKEILNGGI